MKNDEKTGRLSRIVDFCRLVDKEKFIRRRTYLTDGERFENDAEHAWHLAVMALLLSEYAEEETFAYDTEGLKTQKERENAAADRLFSYLPEDLGMKIRALWEEFEADATPEAHFAHTLDNFQPMMLQAATDGKAWKEGGRKLSEVLGRNSRTARGSKALWEFAKANFISPQLDNGHLMRDTDLE